MNGFDFRQDDIELPKDKIIEGIVYYLKDFKLLEPDKEADLRDFLRERIDDDGNYVVHKAEWEARPTPREKFVYLCALAEVPPTDLAPWLK